MLSAHLPNSSCIVVVPPPAPQWTAYVTAVVVPIIAVIGAWIAFRQSQIARNKLKLDLYDRRFEVYQTVQKTLGTITVRGKLGLGDEAMYLSGIQTAKWLFGPEVVVYLETNLWRKIVDFGMHNTMSEGPPSEERNEHVRARAEVMKWLMDQHKELDRLCAPYLRLKH
jgi:hypothetical protein